MTTSPSILSTNRPLCHAYTILPPAQSPTRCAWRSFLPFPFRATRSPSILFFTFCDSPSFSNSRSNDSLPIKHCSTSMLNKSSRYPTPVFHLHVFLLLGTDPPSFGHFLASYLSIWSALPGAISIIYLFHLIDCDSSIFWCYWKGRKSRWASRNVRLQADLTFITIVVQFVCPGWPITTLGIYG